MIDEATPVLNSDIARFGADLRQGGRQRTWRARRGLVVVFAALLAGVPVAVGAASGILVGDGDRPQLAPPPGYVVPRATGTGVAVASGQLPAGAWIAYASACGGRAGVVVVTPDGSRNSAGCGAIRPGGRSATPAFAPSTLYDGLTQTTWIYDAVPSSVARVSLDLIGRAKDGPITLAGAGASHHELTPVEIPAANAALGVDVRFVVLALPGEQSVRRALAMDAAGRVLTRCEATGSCKHTGLGAPAQP